MLISKLTDIVLIITGFELLILSIVILFQNQGRKITRYFLVVFLITKSLLIIRWSLYKFSFINYENSYVFYHLSVSLFFLLAPEVYIYIKALCFRDYHLKWKTAIHLIPFIIIFFFQLITVLIIRYEIFINNLTIWFFISNHFKIFWGGNFIQILVYIFAALFLLMKYRRGLKQSHSYIDKINMNWFYSLISVLILHWFFVVSRAIFSLFNIFSNQFLSLMDLFSISIFLVFATVLVFKGLQQSKIFSGIDESMKYQISKIPDKDFTEYKKKILIGMEEQKAYLQPALTIEEFAKMISTPVWIVSRVINESLNMNFFNFVNNYRIELAKKMFNDNSNENKTVLEILYDCGFNSKSTFNYVFKKYTGMTPTEYKHKIIKSKSA